MSRGLPGAVLKKMEADGTIMKVFFFLVFGCFFFTLTIGSSPNSETESGMDGARGSSQTAGTTTMQHTERDNRFTWGYWLQNIDIDRLRESSFDIVVIDYARDGHDATAFSKTEIAALQSSGKRVLAYFSIGEAEEYRFYWEDDWTVGSPSFIDKENPNWPGNFKVKYWEEIWWEKALEPYLRRIVAAGYDGVYLDIVDAYYYYGSRDGDGRNEDRLTLMADRMIDLIVRIERFGREHATGVFDVCIQNGLSIIEAAAPTKAAALLETISYAALESLFFNTTPETRNYRLGLLGPYYQNGITILNVEYITAGKAEKYWKYLSESEVPITGLIAAPDRSLSTMPVPP